MVSLVTGFGTTEFITFWIDQTSAAEANAPAVPVLTVPAICKIGLEETAEDIATGVAPVLTVVPVEFDTVMVVVVDAVMVKLPLLPVAPPVYPEIVIVALTHPFEPAPVSVAARVYVHDVPPGWVGAVDVLNATVVLAPVTVGVLFAHVHAAASPVA